MRNVRAFTMMVNAGREKDTLKGGEMECDVCHRNHTPEQPCPLRVANAYLMQPQALEKLTEADKNWMAANPSFSVLDTLEDAIADEM